MKLQNNQQILNKEQAEAEAKKRNINPDVYNALNLYNEKLGEEYEKQGYNPFEPDFKLTEEFAKEVLERKEIQGNIPKEAFLEVGAKKATSYFKNTLKVSEVLTQKLEEKMSDISLNASTIHQLQRAVIFLKNRNQLLKRNIRELKFKNANTIQMFADMYGLDRELSDLLKESYENEVDVNAILQQFINTCIQRGDKAIKKREKEQKAEKEQKEKERELFNTIGTAIKDTGESLLNDLQQLAESVKEVVTTTPTPEQIAAAQQIQDIAITHLIDLQNNHSHGAGDHNHQNNTNNHNHESDSPEIEM